MTSGLDHARRGPRARQDGPRSARRELALALLLGAAGAGLIFLASRQGWAEVRTIPPKPLPASRVTVSGAALVPYAEALVVAGLATLAAVLASRGLLRRITGALLAVLGATLAASAFTVVERGGHLRGEFQHRAGHSRCGLGHGRQRHRRVRRAERRGRCVACHLQRRQLAGTGGRRSDRDDRGRTPHRLAGRPDGRDVKQVRLARRCRQAPGSAAAGAAGAADSASIWEALTRGDDPTSAAVRAADR